MGDTVASGFAFGFGAAAGVACFFLIVCAITGAVLLYFQSPHYKKGGEG